MSIQEALTLQGTLENTVPQQRGLMASVGTVSKGKGVKEVVLIVSLAS